MDKLFKSFILCIKVIKNICFFSAGFAFNRLNRLRYYEETFPRDVQIYLFTTNRFKGKEKENYQYEWDLKRTKIITAEFNWKLPFVLRRFCREEKIDRIVNLGNRSALILFFLATVFSATTYYLSMMGWVTREKDAIKKPYWNNLKDFFSVRSWWFFYLFGLFAEKVISVDFGIYKRLTSSKRPFLSKIFIDKKKIIYLPFPVNTNLFEPKNKKISRKKLKLDLNKKIVIFVGRVSYGKCSDILISAIKSNPDVIFIVIGRAMGGELFKLKSKNIIYIEKKSSAELVDYYNAADIGLFMHRDLGGGLGQTTAESIACGLPTITVIREGIEKSFALYQIPVDAEEADKIIKKFFKKPKKEREKLSKEIRGYTLRNYSKDIWEKPYIDAYLN